MSDIGCTFTLPSVAKMEDCEKLHAFLSGAQDKDIAIDCSAVTRLSGLAAQLLLMGHQASTRTGNRLVLANPSPECMASLETPGLQNTLQTEGAAK